MKEKAGKKAVQKRGRGNETIGREEVKEAMKEGRIQNTKERRMDLILFLQNTEMSTTVGLQFICQL